MNTNDIYEQIFNRLMEEVETVKNIHGIDITQQLPKIYKFYDVEEQELLVVDQYTLELDGGENMTFYINRSGDVYDEEKNRVGRYIWEQRLIELE
tara:strand:- start:190 stop:474 length:285 start_codon:yes stop_codon:yes gene_type:complete